MTHDRIVVIGTTGTGKSTLARAIAAAKNIPAIDLDELYWLPGWAGREDGDFRARAEAVTRGEKWVAAGNYTVLRDILWTRADTVIWLDYPFLTALARLLCRTARRLAGKTVICNGNMESPRRLLSGDSIVVWLFKSFRVNRKKYAAIFGEPGAWPHITFLRFRDPGETEAWVKGEI